MAIDHCCGINRNHGEDADDMVSLHDLTDAQRIISSSPPICCRSEDIRRSAKGGGPKIQANFSRKLSITCHREWKKPFLKSVTRSMP